MNPILSAILSALMSELEADPTLIPDLVHAGVGYLKSELAKVALPKPAVIGGSNVVA
jgi:hypothetical protein